jgi:alpha-1,3-mannosyltransferase
MRVAHVVRQYLPSIGGMEEVVRSLAQHQLNNGLQPYIVTLNKVFREPNNTLISEEIIDGVPVYRLPYSGSERYPIAPSVLSHIQNADLVHVHGIDFFFDFLAFTKLVHGKPLLASTHGGFFHTEFASTLKKFYFNTITRLSSKAYSSIICTSENDGELFKRIVPQSKLNVIENGVDIDKFENSASASKKATLIYFGRWSSNKGILDAVNVLAELVEQDPKTPWRLIITGREYDLNTQHITDHAKKLSVIEKLTVIPNPSTEEIKELIGQASYFICLSRHEGFGIAPIEAMSAGLYPLLSNIPPFKRLFDLTNIGEIFYDKQPSAIAKQIMTAHEKNSFNQASIISSVTPYSWQGVCLSYKDQYTKVMTNI